MEEIKTLLETFIYNLPDKIITGLSKLMPDYLKGRDVTKATIAAIILILEIYFVIIAKKVLFKNSKKKKQDYIKVYKGKPKKKEPIKSENEIEYIDSKSGYINAAWNEINKKE